MHQKSGPNELTITIDSGHPRTSSRNVPRQPGVRYVTANGGTMSNRGEKHIRVLTTEGHKCMLKMQVTDVEEP